MLDPRAEYQTRLEQRTSRVRVIEKAASPLPVLRLAAGSVVLVVGWLSLGVDGISILWVLASLVFLGLLIARHARLKRRAAMAQRAVEFYRDGLLRLDGSGRRRVDSSSGWVEEDHLYADDLGIFGDASLFSQICTARTRWGRRTLASWLAGPAQPETIRARQGSVEDLRNRLDLREDLAVFGEEAQRRISANRFSSWVRERVEVPLGLLRFLAMVLPHATLVILFLTFFFRWGVGPLLAAVAVQGIFGLTMRGRVLGIVEGLGDAARELEVLSSVLQRFEEEKFESEHLIELAHRAAGPIRSASLEIRRLALIGELVDSRRNQMFAFISYLLLWTTNLALLAEGWRRRCGQEAAGWLDSVGEFEALSSLAGFAFENPHDVFPEIVPEAALFEAFEIGHPLIPVERCVRNDIRLDGRQRLLMVSGSNMSGKTTLLRSVGVNAVLAYAGGTVRAKRLRLGVMGIGATLRVQDSLEKGISRFYAEIIRIQRILEMAQSGQPTLFLLDEILHGTNSHDRAIGAEAVVRAFIGTESVGLITTHDLALTAVAEDLDPQAINVHFEDRFEDGKLVFDYRLLAGKVERSNALDLMRAVGLKV